MSDNRKPQIEPQVKTDQAVAGFAEIGKAAEDMGKRVSGAGKEASKGVDGIGDKAPEAAQKFDRSTKSIIGSIERATAALQAGERGSAAYFETLAKQRGISGEALRPYLEQLRQAEAAQKVATASLGQMGLTAKQTTQALRQVPAQFTDIIVSLQGGQAPLTVLLQQGGQLRDVFGSAGAAAKALGGFIAGLVTPFTVAGAAIAAVGAGFFLGRKEAEEFNKAILLTGNQAGLTVGQLSAMAARLDALGTTQGKASEALGEFVRAGRVGAESLERFSLAAINLEKVGGPAVQETAKAFADLGKDPLQASLKLNEATGFLTKSLYEQIRALTDQGRGVEAAKVAQDAYAASIEDAVPKIVAQLGYVEQAWKGITTFAKEAADAIKGIGRVDNTLQAAIARTQKQLDGANAVGDALAANEAQRLLERLQQSLKLEQDVGKAKADQAKQTERAVEADKELERLGVKRLTLVQQEEALRRKLVEGGKDEETIQKAIAALREKNASKADNAAARERAQELQREATLLEKLAGLSGTYIREIEDLNRAYERGSITLEQYTERRTKLTAEQPAAVKAEKERAAAIEQSAKAYDQLLNAIRSSAQGVAEQVQRLQDEEQATLLAAAGNITLSQALQQVAIARLQDRQARSQDITEVDALQREIDKRRELIGLLGGQEARRAAAKAAEDASKELDRFLDPSRAESFGDALTRAFDGAGNALVKLSNGLQSYAQQQAQIAATQEDINLTKKTDPAKALRAQLKLNEQSQKASVALYANMAGAAKGFFNEGTKGYKALEAAENAFRVYQLASDLQKGISAATVAVANQGQGDPYTAFPRMAAMAAAMAALGFAVSGGFASGPSGGGDGRPVNTGTGTVLGDAAAQSESITRSIDRLTDTAALQLTTQSGMLDALRAIESSIGGITGLVLRGRESSGGPAEQFGIVEGKSVSGLFDNFFTRGFKLFGTGMERVIGALFGTKRTITGNGLFAGAQDLSSIIGGGLNLQDFADVNTTRKFFGIKTSSRNSTVYQDADPVLQQQFGLVFKSFYDAVKLAAGPLDLNLQDVVGRLDSFVVDIGKIDLSGLTGEEIQERLTAVLGAAGDRIAEAAIPGLQAFQNVGEGYFETVVRVASGIETAEAALELLGISAINFTDITRKQADVAAEIVRQSIAQFESADGSLSSVGALVNTLDGAAEDLIAAYRSLVDVRDILISVGESGDSLTAAMIRGAGGLDQLQSSLADYLENFFSDAERDAAGKSKLQGQFDRLGLGQLPATREAFRAIVEGVDTSTEAGQKLFAQLVSLSGAFADLVPAIASVADTTAETVRRLTQSYADSRTQLEIELLRANGDEAGARARERAAQLARDTVGLSETDAAAIAALYDYNRALRDQIDAARAAVEAQRAIEQAQKTAAEAAQRAADDLRRVFDDLGGTRFDLENQILGLQGKDSDVLARTRARDLAQLTQGLSPADAAAVTAAYDYNLALRKQIEQMQAAQQAAEELAQQQAQSAQEANRAAEQFRDAWQSVTDTLFDEAARIRGLIGGDGAESFASAQTRFALTTAQARAGDQEAAKLLPGLSQTLLQLAEANAGSLLDLQRIRAQIAASLERTGSGLAGRFGLTVPSFDVGTNYVPRDTLALVHEGEAIVPKAFNPSANGAGKETVAELRALREENKAQALAVVKLQTEINKLLKKWDSDGIPEERATA